MVGKLCSGLLNLGKDSGCIWYWMFVVLKDGLVLVKIFSWFGDMDIGLECLSRYFSLIFVLLN